MQITTFNRQLSDLISQYSFWPAKWSDVSGANKQQNADHHV